MSDTFYDEWFDPDEPYEEQPLYRAGFIAGLSDEKLLAEHQRQMNIHDSAVDRCEEINSPTIENAAARCRLVEAEMKRRGLR